MGAARKLQAEIDRTLKKVQEGILEFDQIWDKVYDADSSQSQREKYEGDLKKEIKKLQRLRDQIKTWINGSDIKDKSNLTEARRNIEKKMEQFKNCEKEAKTKAFSKAGLGQAAKLDPEEKARQSTREWLNEQVEALQMQIDEFEAELEALNGSKRGKKSSDRQQTLEEWVARHQGHISRLEQCMRCLDNCTVTYQEVDDLRENVEYYVSENREDEYSFLTVDEIFANVLDRLEDVTLGLQAVNVAAKAKKAKDLEEEIAERERDKERAAAAAVKAQLASQGSNVATAVLEEEKKITRTGSIVAGNSTVATQSPLLGQNSLSSGGSKRRISLSEPPSGNHLTSEETEGSGGDTSATKAGVLTANAVSTAGVKVESTQNTTTTTTTTTTTATTTATGSNGNLSFASAAAGKANSSNSIIAQRQPSITHSSKGEDGEYPKLPGAGNEKPKSLDLQHEGKPNLARSSMDALPLLKISVNESSHSQQGNSETSTSAHGLIGNHLRAQSSSVKGTLVENNPNSGGTSQSNDSNPGSHVTVDPMLTEMSLNQLIGSLSMQCADIQGVPVSPGQFEGNAIASLQLLQTCKRGAMPQPADGDYKVQLSHNTARAISHQLPASYPIHRLPQLEDPNFYQNLDSEGLFYAFYFHPGDVTQHCAAKELNRKSWRYHVEHKSWFRRDRDPPITTEDYEEGSYIYFDRVLTNSTPGEATTDMNGWCYRKKDHFMFRYDQLEDDSH